MQFQPSLAKPPALAAPSKLADPSVLVPLLVFGALAAVPLVAQALEQPFYIALFTRIMLYALAATALNIALGFGGMVSLGHALFLGLGTYSVAIPSFYGIDNGWVHLAVCLAVCGVVGLITGAISLRTTGIGFIMITLAFAQMGYFVFVSLKQYGGDDGTSIMGTSKFFGTDLGQPLTLYVVTFLMLALATWWIARLRVAPFGMALRGARQNARRVNAIGLRSKRYQLAAYVLSALLCGVAGMLMANLTAFASPSTLSWIVSGELIVMVVIGGIGTVFGPVLGAAVFLGVEEVLRSYTEYYLAIFGAAIVVMALVGKSGIVGLLENLRGKRAQERAHEAHLTPPQAASQAREEHPAPATLRTEGLVKRYGGVLVTDAVSIDVRPGELHAVIGPNGAGKTTLINQLSGELDPNEGKVWFDGLDVTARPIDARARLGLLRSYQITSIFEQFSVRENVVLAALGAKEHGFRFWQPMLARAHLVRRADDALRSAGLAARAQVPASELAYGERRQLELAMALAAQPRFLLLDEPMAGMSAQESAGVVALLKQLKGKHSILLIEHDMDAVFALADRITVLVYGKVMFTGTPDEVRQHPEVKTVYLGEEEF